MSLKSNKYIVIAVLLGLSYHCSAIFFTLEASYDAMIHVFFAEHYANNWFEHWNYKWYTGFSMMSYTPLVHHLIAVLSFIAGLKFGLFMVATFGVIVFITGVYRFSYLLTSHKTVAGYAAIFATVSSSFTETLHIFGQLPSIIGVAFLLHSMPEIYSWLRTGKYRYLLSALSLIGVVVVSHHVTIIFGMVFFVFPLIGMVIMDISRTQVDSFKAISFNLYVSSFLSIYRRILSFTILTSMLVFGAILPYWINTKNNPITQVPIPHGSRDHFFEVGSSGLMFFLIPWGVLLCVLPYVFYRFYSKKHLFFGLSLSMLTILGTGGTTPIPKMILGENAYTILTLDRFTLWASIMAIPMFGELMYRLTQKDLKEYLEKHLGFALQRLSVAVLALLTISMVVFTMCLSYFKPIQPQKIKMQPIVNFLNQDQHYRWRYLTLGFGDQMAWLAAKTNALSVDGNYHSARRLPELTTRAVERLENSKYRGTEGLGSLQQFLTIPEKYHLKFIFSNDKFYDPLLYFCGWQRLIQLENGVMVWEKLNVKPLSSILPKETVQQWQKIAWGIIPMTMLFLAFVMNIERNWIRRLKHISKLTSLNFTDWIRKSREVSKTSNDQYTKKNNYDKFSKKIVVISFAWFLVLVVWISFGIYQYYIKNNANHSPSNVVLAYFDALDFREFDTAHTLINPTSKLSLEQYMLEISSTDGLLSSYSKLDSIASEISFKNDTLAIVNVTTTYITSLKKIKKKFTKTVTKHQGKWYINPENLDTDIPPDQLYSINSTNFYNQGRKKISTEQTYHEDILKQPTLEIRSAKLIKHQNQYAIVGEIQNIDNTPADIILKGVLYNDASQEIAEFNAKLDIKHKLLPKEITSFKINFEGIAWLEKENVIPTTFNPQEFTKLKFSEKPTQFVVHASSTVSGAELYKNATLSDLSINGNNMHGSIFNSGLDEITVPQVLITYYDSSKTMVWVEHLFLDSSIKQQRKQTFQYDFITTPSIEIISDDMSKCFINGLPNLQNAQAIVPSRTEHHSLEALQPTNNNTYPYIKIELNSYIGKPN